VLERFFELLAIGASDERDRLLAMLHQIAGEERLVVFDQMHDVLAGDVLRGGAHDVAPVEVGVPPDALDAPVRHLRAHRPSPELAGKREIVQIFRAAGDLAGPVDARRRAAHQARLDLRLLHARTLTTTVGRQESRPGRPMMTRTVAL